MAATPKEQPAKSGRGGSKGTGRTGRTGSKDIVPAPPRQKKQTVAKPKVLPADYTPPGAGGDSGGPGRDTKWSQELQELLCAYLMNGVPISTACDLVGMSERTFYNWVSRGEGGEEPFLQFLQDTARARAHALARAEACVQLGMPNDPKLALEWLKTRDHKNYHIPKEQPAEPDGSQAMIKVSAEIRGLSPAQLRALVLELTDDE